MNRINETEASGESSIEEFQEWQRAVLGHKKAECEARLDKIRHHHTHHGPSHTDLDGNSLFSFLV